jgi:hypothetical protein
MPERRRPVLPRPDAAVIQQRQDWILSTLTPSTGMAVMSIMSTVPLVRLMQLRIFFKKN